MILALLKLGCHLRYNPLPIFLIFSTKYDIKYLFETGYYLESYVGYSHNFRQIGASGGMATWLLTTLLQENIVDYVIDVDHSL